MQCAVVALVVDGETRGTVGSRAHPSRRESAWRPVVVVEGFCTDGVVVLSALMHLIHLPTHERPIAVRSEDHDGLTLSEELGANREVGESDQALLATETA